MSEELRNTIKKIERENHQRHTSISNANDQYDDELDTDCLRLSSHS